MKITLATLPQATAQQVFDQVAQHLLTQAMRSCNEHGCAYRGFLPRVMCAAGCLIDDSEYTLDFEEKTWGRLVILKKVPEAHVELIKHLQNLHDHDLPSHWPSRLTSLAGKFNLNDSVVVSLLGTFHENHSLYSRTSNGATGIQPSCTTPLDPGQTCYGPK